MEVVWTPEAESDRDEIWAYIAADDVRAAARIDHLFSVAAARLATHPEIGKPGRLPGTREVLPHRRYRLVYEIDQGTIWILALVHTARLWPPIRE